MAPSIDKQTPTKMVNIMSSEENPMEICDTVSENAVFQRDYVHEFHNKTTFDFDTTNDRLSNQSPALLHYAYHDHLTCDCMVLTRKLVDSSDHQHEENIWYNAVMGGVLQGVIAINGSVDTIRWTPLQLTVRRGDYEMMERLLRAGANANIYDTFGNTALHLAAKLGDVRAVEILLNPGAANPHTLNERGFTSLALAVQSGCTQLVKMLLDQPYCNVNELIDDHAMRRKFTLLHCAIECNHLMMVQLLLECQADVNQHDSFGNSCLHLACRLGHIDIVELLLRYGARVHEKSGNNLSALSLAVQNGHTDIFEMLLSYGANLNEQGLGGTSPLHYAITSDNVKLVHNLLSRGAHVNATNKFGQTPLHYSIAKKNWRALELLLKYGAEVNSKDSLGKTSLHMAIEAGRKEIYELLLDYGADANAKDNMDQTPLHLAVKQGHIDTVKLLLSHNADVNACDTAQQTPLHLAVRFAHIGLFELMLKHNVDVNVQDSNGLTPLHLAVLIEHVKLIYCDYSFTFFHELLKCGARVCTRTLTTGETPLHLAVKKRCTIFTKHLLLHGSDVDAIDNVDKKTPLQIAVENEDVECVEQLLTFGANINKLLATSPSISKNVVKTIARHFISKLAAGMTVDPNYSKIIDRDEQFARQCEDEVKKLKLTKIHNEQTYYDFLRGNRRSLVNFVDNHEVCCVFKDDSRMHFFGDENCMIKRNFPAFADMLQRNYHVGVRYAPVLDAASERLSSLLQLPTVPIERILDFLNDQDMCNIVQAVPSLTDSSCNVECM